MLKSELEDLCASQQKRIDELESEECESPAVYGYLVFAGVNYTPEAGWECYRQCFAAEEDAREFAGRIMRDEPEDTQWAQVVELPTGRMEWYNPD